MDHQPFSPRVVSVYASTSVDTKDAARHRGEISFGTDAPRAGARVASCLNPRHGWNIPTDRNDYL